MGTHSLAHRSTLLDHPNVSKLMNTFIIYVYLLFLFLEVMEKILKLNDKYSPGPFKLWLGLNFGVIVIKPEDVQVIIF